MVSIKDPLPAHSVVGVLGYGASGQAATRLLRHVGKVVVVADAHRKEPPPAIEGVRFNIGSHDVEDATAVVLSPSFNPQWPENQAKASLNTLFRRSCEGEIELVGEIELALRAFDRPCIVIGGTDGKSTTAAVTHALSDAFDTPALLGGNSWTALSACILDPAHRSAAVGVVEISAFQLHEPHKIRPAVAVLTNIAADHLDHYENFEAYAHAKLSMFMHQGPGDTAVLFGGDPRIRAFGQTLQERGVSVLWFDNAPLTSIDGAGEDGEQIVVRRGDIEVEIPFDAMRVLGPHNRRNVMASVLAWISLIGRAPDRVKLTQALQEFRGLPHRVRFVKEVNGVAYYNDSKATNVHAACVGIASMRRPTIAIVGGVEKHLSLDALWPALGPQGRMIIAIGELQERLVQEAPASLPVLRAASMEEAVCMAHNEARDGDAVLLAPTSSSFDMFSSFEARGDAFEAAVQRLDDTRS